MESYYKHSIFFGENIQHISLRKETRYSWNIMFIFKIKNVTWLQLTIAFKWNRYLTPISNCEEQMSTIRNKKNYTDLTVYCVCSAKTTVPLATKLYIKPLWLISNFQQAPPPEGTNNHTNTWIAQQSIQDVNNKNWSQKKSLVV